MTTQTETAPQPTTETAPQQPAIEPSAEDVLYSGAPQPSQQPESAPAASEAPVEQQTESAPTEPVPQQPDRVGKLEAENAQLRELVTKFLSQQQQVQQQAQQPAQPQSTRLEAALKEHFDDRSGAGLRALVDALREEMDKRYTPRDAFGRVEQMAYGVAMSEEERRVQGRLTRGGEVQADVDAAKALVDGWVREGKPFPDLEAAYDAALSRVQRERRGQQMVRTQQAQQQKRAAQATAGMPANKGSVTAPPWTALKDKAADLSAEEVLDLLA